MTRVKCLEAIARGFIGEGPWNDPLTTDERRKSWLSDAEEAFDALHGIAFVTPLEATKEMIAAVDCAGEKANWPSGRAWKAGWRAMAAAGDLTKLPD